MGIGTRFYEWVESRVNRPADRSVLNADRNPGSESLLDAGSPAEAQEAAQEVRRSRARRRWRWMNR